MFNAFSLAVANRIKHLITFVAFHRLLALIAVLMALMFITGLKFDNLREKMYAMTNIVTASDRMKELDCLALNVYREAGAESFEGKVAVAQVTINRSQNEQFPKNICHVVYQKNIVMEKVVCQFSWACDQVHRTRPINAEAYEESYRVATQVLLEGFRLPSLTNALYYHADYVNPGWRHLEKITKIGAHIFYKPKG